MRHLIDAHCLIWALDDPSRLGNAAGAALQNPASALLVSAGTVWELSIKTSLGKQKLSLPFRAWVDRAVADLGLTVLAIAVDHAERQARLPFHHRDPFDRLLAAQALVEASRS
jgi:PIN domain nuclease of toxin-antitoxin system